MEFFKDTLSEQLRIDKAIKKYGYAPEHNFWWLQAQSDENLKNVFVQFDDGVGLFTIEREDKKNYIIFSSPIAPVDRRVPIVIEYLEYIFSQGVQKVTLEFETPLYKEFIKALPVDIKARAINYTLTWPIYNLGVFDPNLSGKHWKTLRKEKNRFYQNYKVEVVDAKTFQDKESLHKIIDAWKADRVAEDRAHFFPYHNFIDKNFEGATEARVFVVDGKPVGINAGWLIQNSCKFYGAMGIHDYSLPDLGDMLYLEDLAWLKSKGYKEADMGGGEEALTNFKKKFQPKSFYDTHIFSVIKN